jgi:hypothetical protein
MDSQIIYLGSIYMSAKEEINEPTKLSLDDPSKPEIKDPTKPEDVQPMVREEVPVKKCCMTKKENVHVAAKCCAYSWCISLNGIECCCVSLSKLCIIMSDIAICCN